MIMSEQTIPIPGRLKNAAIGGHVTGSEDIDAGEGKTQKQVNDETNDTLALHQSEISGLNSQNYVSVSTYSSLPATGNADTIYRVSSWDGNANSGEGAADVTKYTEYAWNGTAYIVVSVKTQIGEVFDISEYKAVGGTLAKFADLSAALDGGNNVPAGIRKGGMSVKFVQSSDNKYVRCNLLANSFTTDTTQWTIIDEGVYVENPEFVYVKTDAEGKILWAIKTDGNIYYGAGVPQQVIDYIEQKIAELSLDKCEDIIAFLNGLEEGDKTLQTLLNEKVDKEDGKSLINSEFASNVEYADVNSYMSVETDKEGKILGGRKKDGTNFENVAYELDGARIHHVDNNEFVEVVTDAYGKILSSTRKDGSHYIYNVDSESIKKETKFDNNLKDQEDAFPLGTEITGTYGQQGAIYNIPLGNYNKLHVYFEFHFTGRIPVSSYNNIVSIGNNKIQLSCVANAGVYGGLISPYFLYALNWSSSEPITPYKFKPVIGEVAFRLKFTDDITTQDNDDIVVVFGLNTVVFKHSNGEILDTLSYTDEESVYSLVNKINALSYVECVGINTAAHTCSELLTHYDAEFSVKLVDNFTPDNQGDSYKDTPIIYVPYATNNDNHSIEIIIDKTEEKIYTAFDGLTLIRNLENTGSNIALGNITYPIVCKNLHISIDELEDAEIITVPNPRYTTQTQLISNHNPKLIVWEGHGVDACMDADAPLTDTMAVSTDRLLEVFETLKKKGYVFVSWGDILEWKINGKPLPKRCFNLMFDDYRVGNYINYNNRLPFERYNIKPGLAIIEDYNRNDTIEFNGTEYTKGECSDICILAEWYPCSHALHQRLGSYRVSNLPGLFKTLVLTCNKLQIHSDIIVYPYGSVNGYCVASLSDSNFKLGVMTTAREYNCKARSDFYLTRYEIGTRTSIENVINVIV